MSSLALHLEDDGLPGALHDSEKPMLDVLQQFLQPDSNISIENAARMIFDLLPDPTEHHRAGEPGMLGGVVYEVSQQIPYRHPSQIKLVRLIQRLAVSTKMSKAVSDEGYTFYSNSEDFRDLLRGCQPSWFEGSSPGQFTKYINFSAFLARLTECYFVEDATYAIWTMRDALEEDHNDDQIYSCLVSAAAVWILFSGQNLFVQIVQVPMSAHTKGEKASTRAGSLFGGPNFGLERWRFWKKAFAAAIERQGSNEECKRLASKAVDFMGAIERNMTL